jgi:hypothetical protein
LNILVTVILGTGNVSIGLRKKETLLSLAKLKKPVRKIDNIQSHSSSHLMLMLIPLLQPWVTLARLA